MHKFYVASFLVYSVGGIGFVIAAVAGGTRIDSVTGLALLGLAGVSELKADALRGRR